MKNRAEKLEIVFQYDGLDGQKLLDIILVLLDRFGFYKKFFIHEKSIPISKLIKKIKEKGHWPTGVTSENFEFRYGVVGNRDQSFFYIKEKLPGLIVDWHAWVFYFLEVNTFIQAWISDVEYDYWQNVVSPDTYRLAGKEYLHLPTKSNGLPYPLTDQIMDNSKNPGRWEFCMGYMEAIGSTMWLGENFWNYVGQDKKQKLFDESWIRTEILENGVVKLIAADECFMDESTADKQNCLREIIYGSV